ncbi:MAG TPA: carboxypeptidase-like regulatory domain-containing protein, partial [Hymenobacter sp.]
MKHFQQFIPLAWLKSSAVLILAGMLAKEANAQATINGSIQTQAGARVEYATVTLHRATDSVLVKSEFSDGQGGYRFEQVAAGRYLVSASQVGFVRRWSTAFDLGATG